MTYNQTPLAPAQDNVLMMNPDRGGADFDDEGSGAASGYGDTTEDDLLEDADAEDEETLPTDSDDDDESKGDDIDDDDL